jgi:ABC-2 type transport system ATP-binding protein
MGFSYGKDPLFKDLDLSATGGTIYGLLGMNGAGKTTLLKLLTGQLFPKSGSIDVLGFDPRVRHPKMLEDIFYLPEEFYLPKCRVEEYLGIYAPFYPKFNKEAFARYLEQFSIDRGTYISSYSFGQKKKFLLAFGLATESSILILDEPTNGLDIPSKSQFRRTIASAINDQRVFIISTHQVRDMEHLIDPIMILHDGNIIFNRQLGELEQEVTISRELQMPAGEEVIYSEKVSGGYSVLRRRQSGDDYQSLDLELLFNAVIAHPQEFSKHTGKEVHV